MSFNMEKEKEKVHKLLVEALPMLCRNAIHYDTDLSIEALVGVTIDRDKVLLVSIKKDFQRPGQRIKQRQQQQQQSCFARPQGPAPQMISQQQLRQVRHQQVQQQPQRVQFRQQQHQQMQRMRQQQQQQMWMLDIDDDDDEEEEDDEDEEDDEEWERHTLLMHHHHQQQQQQQQQQQLRLQTQQEDNLMAIRNAALNAVRAPIAGCKRSARSLGAAESQPTIIKQESLATQHARPSSSRASRRALSTVTSSDLQQPPTKRAKGPSNSASFVPTVTSIKKEVEDNSYSGVYSHEEVGLFKRGSLTAKVKTELPDAEYVEEGVQQAANEGKTRSEKVSRSKKEGSHPDRSGSLHDHSSEGSQDETNSLKAVRVKAATDRASESNVMSPRDDKGKGEDDKDGHSQDLMEEDEEAEEEEEEEQGEEAGDGEELDEEDGAGAEDELPAVPNVDIPVRISAAEVKKLYKVVKGETLDDENGTQSQATAFCCVKCTKTYNSEISIEDHILVEHMKILRYSCHVCDTHFGFQSALKLHLREEHEID